MIMENDWNLDEYDTYSIAAIQKDVKSEWIKLKKLIPKQEGELKQAIKDFEKVLNYFYE